MRSEPVFLLDVNVLVALALDTHVHHRAAHAALRTMTNGWATCAVTESGMLRLLINPAVTGRSFTAAQVLAVVAGMHAHPRWAFLAEDRSVLDSGLDLDALIGHQQVTDFHLVSLAARHNALLATFDGSLPTALAPADRRHVRVLPI